jgi:hypothetical protein
MLLANPALIPNPQSLIEKGFRGLFWLPLSPEEQGTGG